MINFSQSPQKTQVDIELEDIIEIKEYMGKNSLDKTYYNKVLVSYGIVKHLNLNFNSFILERNLNYPSLISFGLPVSILPIEYIGKDNTTVNIPKYGNFSHILAMSNRDKNKVIILGMLPKEEKVNLELNLRKKSLLNPRNTFTKEKEYILTDFDFLKLLTFNTLSDLKELLSDDRLDWFYWTQRYGTQKIYKYQQQIYGKNLKKYNIYKSELQQVNDKLRKECSDIFKNGSNESIHNEITSNIPEENIPNDNNGLVEEYFSSLEEPNDCNEESFIVDTTDSYNISEPTSNKSNVFKSNSNYPKNKNKSTIKKEIKETSSKNTFDYKDFMIM